MSTEYEAPITKILLHYFPHWEVPENRKDWNACLCPAHDEDRPSCSVNFDIGAIKCQACGFKGDVLSIIKRKEEVRYVEALRRAEEILGGCYEQVQGGTAGKRSRKVFGEQGTSERKHSGVGKSVSSRVRSRSSPWS